MKPTKITDEILDKYLNGTCTHAEKQLVEDWYASLQYKRNHLAGLSERDRLDLKQETFRNIERQISEEPVPQKKYWQWAARIAASILFFIGIWYVAVNQKTDLFSLVENIALPSETKHITYKNESQQIVLYHLPDSSSVWLHPQASITYPSIFDESQRNVSFNGQAFFDIQKNPLKPFYIQSGEMKIKVLGTSFNVNALDKNNIFQISVVTGSVQVTAPDNEEKEQTIVLKPKQQGIFEIQSKRLLLTQTPPSKRKEIFEPIDIQFEDKSLEQVINRLQNRFNIQIQLTNSGISNCQITADFEQQSLPVILEMLCTALEASYTISDQIILIDGLPCNY
jgi:transmembrane sensor